MSRRYIEKSRGGEGRKNEMNVEVEVDREGSDVSHPLRSDCRESRCLGCRRMTKLVRVWTATVE
jgi:hypothetical protein